MILDGPSEAIKVRMGRPGVFRILELPHALVKGSWQVTASYKDVCIFLEPIHPEESDWTVVLHIISAIIGFDRADDARNFKTVQLFAITAVYPCVICVAIHD
jgi:hypothetical protein